MPKYAKNNLTIKPYKNSWRLSGYVRGEKIRINSQDKMKLVAMRIDILKRAQVLPPGEAAEEWQREVNRTIERIEAELSALKKLMTYSAKS